MLYVYIYLFIYLFKDFTALSSNKSHDILHIVSYVAGITSDSMLMAIPVVTIIISFESSLELRYWNIYYEGRVNGRYRGWCYQFKAFFEMFTYIATQGRIHAGFSEGGGQNQEWI